MIEHQPVGHTRVHQPRKIPIHERSVRVGDVIVINAHRVNHHLLKQRFAEGGYHLHQTKHFLLFTRETSCAMLAHDVSKCGRTITRHGIHSDISMTMNIYSHVLPTIQEDAVDRLNQAFKEWENEDELEDGEDNSAV